MSNGSIVLFGECFRLGGQHTRIRDKPISFKPQIMASKRQMEFFNHLINTKNTNIDIYIASYKTKYIKEITEIYNDLLVDSIWVNKPIGRDNIIKEGYKLMDKNNKDYDFLLVMRIDIYLRDALFEIFDPHWETIHFPFIEHTTEMFDAIRVNDTMLFIPKKYFRMFKKEYIHHLMLYNMILNNKITLNDFDVMINTTHNANSSSGYNPIYYIVNRNISKYDPNKKYIVYDKYKTFPDRGILHNPIKDPKVLERTLQNYYMEYTKYQF